MARETARTLVFSGREKRKEGRLAEALADFQKAHDIMRVPTTALDLGKTQEALGLLVEARTTYLEATRFPERRNEPAAFRDARAEAEDRAEAIVPRLATLTISVADGARLTLDGVDLPATSKGIAFKVNPGRHVLVASDDKGGEKRTTVEVRPGGSATVALALGGDAPSSASSPDSSQTRAGPSDSDVPAQETGTSPLVWVGLGVLGVGAAVGTTTGLMAFGVKDDVASRCDGTRCPRYALDDVPRGETLGTISTVSFVVAGAGAAVLVYGLVNPTRLTSKTTGVHVQPSVGGIAGTF